MASSVAGAWEGVGWVGRGQVFGKNDSSIGFSAPKGKRNC